MRLPLREQMLARAEALVKTVSTWTHDHPEADLDAREELVWQEGQAFLRDLLTSLTSATEPRTPGRCPRCRAAVSNPEVRQRRRAVLSRFGLLRVARRQLTCRACGHNWRPIDRVLGLPQRQRATRRVRHWLAWLGAEAPYRLSQRLLQELTG